MADVVAGSSDPALGAIRLAWWREALERLDQADPPAEPRLQTIVNHLLPNGVSGAELAKLEDCWAALLEPFPWTVLTAEMIRIRGRILFGIGARLLGHKAEEAEVAGATWALADVAGHCSDFTSRELLFAEARRSIAELGQHKPSRDLRPMTALAAVAAHDVSGGRAVGRGLVVLIHILTGRFPRG